MFKLSNSGDSIYASLEKTLNAIGKSVFVRFYYDFKDANIPYDKIVEKLFNENSRTKSKQQGFRIYRARHIFATGQQIKALELIAESKKVDLEIRDLAKQILKDEMSQETVNRDIEDEKFIISLDKEIVYGTHDFFQYDNTPKAPKNKKEIISEKYTRSSSVSKHALIKANYLCEYDETHFVFKRRNSDKNYTEPHHLVPLSAAGDFPDVDLDREQNVVSLCSNCHNILHYGADYEIVLKPLYENRKELLSAIGIVITYEELKKYYM